MTKKEFHALVNTQWKSFIEGKDKDTRPKRAKDSNESSVTSIESSNLSTVNALSKCELSVTKRERGVGADKQT